ncbi:MAG TPA: 4-(cytidine 5'-diphospho)-2-C-methyl-D-erythritol kinase [Pyrinomonadaceae bacterium]|nr:4-(cytidine 5'-diphospho)-2-C-methyl-D-erythritol kinase [Pyrinomonadaceae bacterium]
MTTTTLKLPSFAKINWFLRVLGKRPDGYHDVVTVLQTISLCDELTFNSDGNEGPLTLTCDDPTIPTDKDNLIIQAATALWDCYQVAYGAEIVLHKRIPTKAGLGGASSNCAVALLGLNAVWGRNFTIDELIDPSFLGADVPFFLKGGTCLATGTGTTLRELPDGPKQHLIVITPNASVSTATAYASLNARSLTTSESASILSSSLAELDSAGSGQWPLRNDFESVIFEIEPEIERVKMALLEAGARGALLAGSGSSVFGVFDDDTSRDRALDNLKCEAGWKVFSCHTLSRAEYFRAMNSSGFPLFTLS